MVLNITPVGNLTGGQRMILSDGILATDKDVPQIPIPPVYFQWAVLDSKNDADVPVGLLTVIPLEDGSCEVGVRMFEMHPSTAALLSKWMCAVLKQYPVVVARVFPRNYRVKRLMQRCGFRFQGHEGKLEVHTVTRDSFRGRR